MPRGAAPTLEDALARIESALAALAAALRRRDALAIETEAHAVQAALASAMHRLAAVARQPGGVPLPLRRRLAVVGGQVAAQRESLARANASLQRALDVLLPPDALATAYAADGARVRPSSSGVVGA